MAMGWGEWRRESGFRMIEADFSGRAGFQQVSGLEARSKGDIHGGGCVTRARWFLWVKLRRYSIKKADGVSPVRLFCEFQISAIIRWLPISAVNCRPRIRESRSRRLQHPHRLWFLNLGILGR